MSELWNALSNVNKENLAKRLQRQDEIAFKNLEDSYNFLQNPYDVISYLLELLEQQER